jgi:uncharacterized RDD family membrane protein YckC
VSFYTGPLEPILPSPAQRALAYALDLITSTLLAVLAMIVSHATLGPAAAAGALLAVQALYFILPTAAFGATPAKLMNGLRVRAANGSTILPDTAILRYLVLLVTQLVPFGAMISFCFVLMSPQRLAIHDRIAGTVVMYRESSEG